jgi:hypothetical protein
MDTRTDTVDVATAAVRLGLTVDGVYKRIKRGRLRVQRIDGRTLVVLDNLSTQVDTAAPTDGRVDGQTDRLDGHVHNRLGTAEPDCEPDPADFPAGGEIAPLVAQLQSENTWLRGEVEAWRAQLEALQAQHAAEISAWHERLREAHVLLVQRPALTAPENPVTQGDEAPLRLWWAVLLWWRR